MADMPTPDTPQPLLPSAPTALDERVAAYETNTLPTDYVFDPDLSVDDNYMVLTLIYARLSMSKRGNMACIIVGSEAPSANGYNTGPAGAGTVDGPPPAKRARTASPPASPPDRPFPNYPGRILAHSNNYPQPSSVDPSTSATAISKPLKPGRQPAKPKPSQSLFLARANAAPEQHAEARSICLAARAGTPLLGSTAYVSFPPCTVCLPLLVAAGCTRLVYRQQLASPAAVELCAREGVERVEVVERAHDERIKECAAGFWRERGEGRDETRARVDRWWKACEERVMGPAIAAQAPALGANEEERRAASAVGAGSDGMAAQPA
ncbi:uncharacterized protein JCM10292_003653 [Rhodotorula paludigena]|uniref:uncharacterized protein n=1 Tax=Rhodotorula paludigena TaxID=86838 RepID=UPI00316F7AE6